MQDRWRMCDPDLCNCADKDASNDDDDDANADAMIGMCAGVPGLAI